LPPVYKVCKDPTCGKAFIGLPRQKLCSPCRTKPKRVKAVKVLVKCGYPGCENTFYRTGNHNLKYCSKDCCNKNTLLSHRRPGNDPFLKQLSTSEREALEDQYSIASSFGASYTYKGNGTTSIGNKAGHKVKVVS
jgi:hypothetical protein